MKEWPLVTYVLLSFNHARFVRQAIESILAQDYPAIELIVVDDGSTDGSVELLRALSAERGFRLLEKSNGGVVSALNAGAPLAAGEFIVPHASDDISHPGRTRAQVALLRENPEVGFTAGGIRKIDEGGEMLVAQPAPGLRRYGFADFRAGRASVPAVSCMYRAEAIKPVLPLDETIAFEDVQLYWRVTEQGWTCLYDGRMALVDYRILRNSLGRGGKVRLWRDFMRFIQRYRDQPWYVDLRARANSGMFVQLAVSEKAEAVRFFLGNAGEITLKAALRGWLALVMPRWLQEKLRRKY